MVVIQQINIKAKLRKKNRKTGELKTLGAAPAKYREIYNLDGPKIVVPNIRIFVNEK